MPDVPMDLAARAALHPPLTLSGRVAPARDWWTDERGESVPPDPQGRDRYMVFAHGDTGDPAAPVLLATADPAFPVGTQPRNLAPALAVSVDWAEGVLVSELHELAERAAAAGGLRRLRRDDLRVYDGTGQLRRICVTVEIVTPPRRWRCGRRRASLPRA